MNLLDKYKKYFFDIEQLYPYQNQAIENLLNGKNTLSIVPTGGGKSLIYQLSSLDMEGTTIIISPLLALMQEQVNELHERGLDNVISINSDLSFEEQRKRLRKLREINPKIIYLSPERLHNYFFRSALLKSNLKISMVVIDEAHCISQWGIDFRPDYSQIKPFIHFLKDNNQNPITYALTATLSNQAREDIISEFEISKESVFICNDVLRTNLNLFFSKVDKEEEKIDLLENWLTDKKPKKSLVYLYNKNQCEELSEIFRDKGYKAGFFHSESNNKLEVYKQFKSGNLNLLFSTTAFGMGINIPDIDSVIHYHIPNSIEEYYQHVGRGARNKKICPECNCLVLWSDKNFDVRTKNLQRSRYTQGSLNQGFEHLNLKGKANQVSTIDFFDYKESKINLPLMKRLFEKNNIIETLGEVNGTPRTIRFYRNTQEWINLIEKLPKRFDSFIQLAKVSGKDVQEIINYIYDEELKGNIEHLPAKERKVFLFCKNNSLSENDISKILLETNSNIDFQLENLIKLRELFISKIPENIIAKELGIVKTLI